MGRVQNEGKRRISSAMLFLWKTAFCGATPPFYFFSPFPVQLIQRWVGLVIEGVGSTFVKEVFPCLSKH